MESARLLFEEMITWNAVMKKCKNALIGVIGWWEDVLSVREAMKKEGRESSRLESIQVENLVKDTKHENRTEIFETLDFLYNQLKQMEIRKREFMSDVDSSSSTSSRRCSVE
ncbi:hypothetical protein C5167_023866 [Papaver somniferum]|uniref:Uncharacterized protein n=1 Tax=Papaver somniferum TaxID=3469 RepID=A0A4Y7JQ94_PAPSO|nr:hypothetical protein C5167_023866 [Papaver somniferum]